VGIVVEAAFSIIINTIGSIAQGPYGDLHTLSPGFRVQFYALSGLFIVGPDDVLGAIALP